MNSQMFDALVHAGMDVYGLSERESRLLFRLIGHLQEEGIQTPEEGFAVARDRGWIEHHPEDASFDVTEAGQLVATRSLPWEEA